LIYSLLTEDPFTTKPFPRTLLAKEPITTFLLVRPLDVLETLLQQKVTAGNDGHL